MQRAQGHQGAHDAEHISHDSTKAQVPLQMAEGHSLPGPAGMLSFLLQDHIQPAPQWHKPCACSGCMDSALFSLRT